MKLSSTKTLAQAIYETTKGKSGVELTHALENTVVFIKKNQLMSRSKEILSHLENIIGTNENIVRAKVKSRDVLSKKMISELEESLKKRYKAKEVEINNMVDEEVIDGIKIEVQNEVIDLTLRHRLNQLQNYLIKN